MKLLIKTTAVKFALIFTAHLLTPNLLTPNLLAQNSPKKIWSCVLLAEKSGTSNFDKNKQTQKIIAQARASFPQFRSWKMLGSAQSNLNRENEFVLKPSATRYFKLNFMGNGAKFTRLQVECLAGKRVLLKTQVKLRNGEPLFIRAPKAGSTPDKTHFYVLVVR